MLSGLIISTDGSFWGERATEGRRWFAELLAPPHSISHAVAYGWESTGVLMMRSSDYAAARTTFDASFQIHADFDEPTHLKYFWLGQVALGEGDLDRAGDLIKQFLILAGEPANPAAISRWRQGTLGLEDTISWWVT